jgi:predicted SAM-dependent methyltransferase
MIKLHIGCGTIILSGYLNCDLYSQQAQLQCNALDLPFKNDTIDEIYSAHVFEHFDFKEGYLLIQEWKRVLKIGGKLVIEIPDLIATCKEMVNAKDEERIMLYPQFFGEPWLLGLGHKFLYTETQLCGLLQQFGFNNIVRVPALRYVGLEKINLKVECIK